MKNHFSHPLFLKVESLAEPVFYGLEENIDLNRSHNYLVKEMKMERHLMSTGTSLYVNIPQAIVELFELKAKDKVQLKITSKSLIVEFDKKRNKSD